MLRNCLLLLVIALLQLTTACQRRAAEQLVDDSLVHLQAAEQMLVDNAGNERKLVEDVMQYRMAHHAELVELRKRGESSLHDLSAADRESVTTAARNRAEPIVARISLAAQRYPDARTVLLAVRPLVVAGTPVVKPGQRPTWLPPEVPPLPELATPTGHSLPPGR